MLFFGPDCDLDLVLYIKLFCAGCRNEKGSCRMSPADKKFPQNVLCRNFFLPGIGVMLLAFLSFLLVYVNF